MICACPSASALPSITNFTCGESFGQIQKIAFQRLTNNAGAKNKFTKTTGTPAQTDNPIETLASWTAFIQDTGSSALGTNIVVTPFVEAPSQEGGDEITFGGGNDTVGGIEKNIGRNPTTMTFALREFPQSVIAELKKLQCERNLGVYLFNAENAVEAIRDTADTTHETYYPIPIRNLFVGDKIHGGFDTPDSNALSFSFAPNYSDELEIKVVSFNPLTDLQ